MCHRMKKKLKACKIPYPLCSWKMIVKCPRPISKQQATFLLLKGKSQGKRSRRRLNLQLTMLKINLDAKFTATQEDFDNLTNFFPDANVKELSKIEAFHKQLHNILNTEIQNEADRINSMISSIDEQIHQVEEQTRKKGIPVNISKRFLDKFSGINNQINALKHQNEEYIQLKNMKEDKKNLTYDFHTPDDTGTGTSYKSLIVFDLTVLKLTELPALAHDSLIFTNIGYEPLEKIMELYTQSKKQIFIAFDRKEAPTKKIQKILNESCVLQLNAGGNKLFGENWGVIKSE